MKNASPPTKRASGRSRASAAKAASISPIELALRNWVCSPRVAAASFVPRNVVSVALLLGLTKTATRTALGTSSCRPQSLGHRFLDEKIGARCVATRPGETGDKTELDRV